MRGPISRAFVAMAGDMEHGCLIGEAMKKRYRVFSPLDVMVVEVADNSGSLPDGLRMLAQWYELLARIKRTVLSGMILPIMVLNIAAFVFPLPQLIIGGFDFARYIWSVVSILLLFYVPLVVLISIIKLSSRGGLPRKIIDTIGYYIPILGGALRDMALSRYCLAFSMMSKAGVSVITTAQSAAELTGNAVVGKMLAGGLDAAKAGNQLSEGFSPGLPLDFIEMWRVAEETGNMDETTAKMAKRYEESAELKFVELARWLPRIFYFFVCLMLVKMIFTLMGGITGAINDAVDI